jgi:hypothetical protein
MWLEFMSVLCLKCMIQCNLCTCFKSLRRGVEIVKLPKLDHNVLYCNSHNVICLCVISLGSNSSLNKYLRFRVFRVKTICAYLENKH